MSHSSIYISESVHVVSSEDYEYILQPNIQTLRLFDEMLCIRLGARLRRCLDLQMEMALSKTTGFSVK